MFGKEGESKLGRVREGVAAGAEHVKEFTREVASATKEKAQHAVRIVREAEPDTELKERARTATERGLDRAGDAVTGAAPAIGRGAEFAAATVGAALKFVARPIGAIIGPIAGTVGGWWKKASEARSDLPAEDEEACRAHFVGLTIHGLTFEQARSGYAIGYLAGCNPDYAGREFEDVEADLRHGFRDDEAEYDVLREFARFGYARGAARPDPFA